MSKYKKEYDRAQFLDITDKVSELGIELSFRNFHNAWVIFEKRENGFWHHLATRYTLPEVTSFLRDLVLTEEELKK